MNEEEFLLDSDSDDEDYKPAGVDNELSEEESGNESDEPFSEGEKNDSKETKKRKNRAKGRTRKRIRNGKVKEEAVKEKEEEKENSEVVQTEEEKKKKSDLLWADFLRDCGPTVKKSAVIQSDTVSESKVVIESKPIQPETKPKPEPKKITQIMEFAGEEVKVEKTLPPESSDSKKGRGSGGLSSVLSLIGKKGKLSTLEKSKLDWERFKCDEGIKEDIEAHNKGRNGYLERQDFLMRADLRQFEIEKNMRANRRSINR